MRVQAFFELYENIVRPWKGFVVYTLAQQINGCQVQQVNDHRLEVTLFGKPSYVRFAHNLPGPIELLVERDGQLRTVVLHFPSEVGKSKKTA